MILTDMTSLAAAASHRRRLRKSPAARVAYSTGVSSGAGSPTRKEMNNLRVSYEKLHKQFQKQSVRYQQLLDNSRAVKDAEKKLERKISALEQREAALSKENKRLGQLHSGSKGLRI